MKCFVYTRLKVPTSLGEAEYTALTLALTRHRASLFPNLDQLSHFPLRETLFLIQPTPAAICQGRAVRSPLHYSCTRLSA